MGVPARVIAIRHADTYVHAGSGRTLVVDHSSAARLAVYFMNPLVDRHYRVLAIAKLVMECGHTTMELAGTAAVISLGRLVLGDTVYEYRDSDPVALSCINPALRM